ncbi:MULTISPECIES: RluA family pseudouridine synthase [Staphylococcus]|uniref:RNA pseudouridylate synthase n=1 Tax=Staphylococcus hsinchuensis TaxID=3051183 RepID=A0ABZ3EA90_9STAP|nr:RluA family pseudouridine synthase [Staphylococcus sp. Marseille-Q6910]
MKFSYQIKSPILLRTFLQNNDYSKKTISAIKNNGAIFVNNEPVTVRKQLEIDDQLDIHLNKEVPSQNLIPYTDSLKILYEDQYLLIVSKPPNQNCAPSREHKHHSLVEQVLGYFNQTEQVYNPHIVTRLDRNTAGIVIFAKHGFIHYLMSKVNIDKRYYCICYGQIEQEGIINAPIARALSSIIERRVDKNGKQAKTMFRCLDRTDQYSLCEVRLLTGRTHQIRVHFKHIGHSLVGDSLYNGLHSQYKHQLLRCVQVEFEHPITHENIVVVDRYKAIESIFNMI